MILRGKTRSTRRKTWPSATLCTTNHTSTGLGSNTGLHCDRPTTNHVSRSTALFEDENQLADLHFQFVPRSMPKHTASVL
jgi:hypothetical protein